MYLACEEYLTFTKDYYNAGYIVSEKLEKNPIWFPTKLDFGIKKYKHNKNFPKDLIIPDTFQNIPVIGIKGFKNNNILETVKLGKYIKKIYTETFLNCRNLKSIDIPKDLEDLGNGAFTGCFKLENINIPEKLIFPTNALPSQFEVTMSYKLK